MLRHFQSEWLIESCLGRDLLAAAADIERIIEGPTAQGIPSKLGRKIRIREVQNDRAQWQRREERWQKRLAVIVEVTRSQRIG